LKEKYELQTAFVPKLSRNFLLTAKLKGTTLKVIDKCVTSPHLGQWTLSNETNLVQNEQVDMRPKMELIYNAMQNLTTHPENVYH
jgi:hypothetical protein